MTSDTELNAIRQRYARRAKLYDPASNWVLFSRQERERAIVDLLRRGGLQKPDQLRLLEIGCGAGDNLLSFLQLGFRPEALVGNELIEDRLARASRRLPADTLLVNGNGAELAPSVVGQFDVVFQSMVFSSILDDQLRRDLAVTMWALVKPGGAVLSYDFIFNNPSNPDVRKVTLDDMRRLFPEAHPLTRRLTLAPPLNRRIAPLGHTAYVVFNRLPLRTHLLCLLRKAN